jgi:hypothetical protein
MDKALGQEAAAEGAEIEVAPLVAETLDDPAE